MKPLIGYHWWTVISNSRESVDWGIYSNFGNLHMNPIKLSSEVSNIVPRYIEILHLKHVLNDSFDGFFYNRE
jgi:hypothetical protein